MFELSQRYMWTIVSLWGVLRGGVSSLKISIDYFRTTTLISFVDTRVVLFHGAG